MAELPIKGRPKEIIRIIRNYVSGLIKKRILIEFYIGRTSNIPEALSRHGSDVILPLYETDSVDNAIEVEDSLIKSFFNHQKCSNDVSHGAGGASDEYTSYVYIAVWYA